MKLQIIWDLDGTLIDSAYDIKYCLELAVKKSGVDLSKQVKQFTIGPTIDIIIKESFPANTVNDDILSKIITSFREIYDNSNFEQTKPFPDIEEIIQNNNFIHHIVTNKPDMPTKKILDKLNWTKYITSVRTPYSNASGSCKMLSKSELFSEVIDEYGGNSATFVAIGDMKNDCIAAKKNSITAIAVLWGSGTREELRNSCDYIFENTKQLLNFIKNEFSL